MVAPIVPMSSPACPQPVTGDAVPAEGADRRTGYVVTGPESELTVIGTRYPPRIPDPLNAATDEGGDPDGQRVRTLGGQQARRSRLLPGVQQPANRLNGGGDVLDGHRPFLEVPV